MMINHTSLVEMFGMSLIQPLRIAFVGAGLFAQRAHLPVILNDPARYTLHTVYSRTLSTAQALAEQTPAAIPTTDLDAVLANPEIDALLLAVPIHAMPALVRRALASGKHLLSEKPLATSLAEGRALVEMYRAQGLEAGQVWVVAENWRYAPAIRRAADVLKQGAIGTPVMFHWAIHAGLSPERPEYHTAWRRDGSHPGGLMLDGGVHFVAGLRMVLGDIDSIQAHQHHARADLPAPDTLTATLRMVNGLVGTFAVTYAVGVPWMTSLTIAGTEGTLQVNRDTYALYQSDTITEQADSAGDGVAAEWAAFTDIIRAGKPSLAHLYDALQDLALVEALLSAAHHGAITRPIQIKKSPS